MNRDLPSRPNLDHLRRQARELLRALAAGEPEALARAAPYRTAPPPTLAHAQLVVAREYGFASWPRLVAEVERLALAAVDDAAFVERVLALAMGRGYEAPQPERALRTLEGRPVDSLAIALVTGDLPRVQRGLAGADLAAPLAPFDAPALLYAAFSSLARLPSHRPGLVSTVQWLLDQGADPNGRMIDPDFPNDPFPALYGASGRVGCFETTVALLQAGAEPNDGESLYHSVEQSDRRIVAALVEAGARWPRTNALFRQLDYDNLEGLRQVLDLGADPNELGPQTGHPFSSPRQGTLHFAIIRGRSVEFLRLLVERGADPLAGDGGRSLAKLAARAGDRAVSEYLASLGVLPDLEGVAGFLASCAAGDGEAARAYLAEHPDAIAGLGPGDLRLLADQAQRGHLAAVRLMVELGWPLEEKGDWGAGPLNQAAFRGDGPMVDFLLASGARWESENGFGGTTMGSCLWAARNAPHPEGDYARVFLALVAAGAPVPEDSENLPEPVQEALALL